MKIKPLWEIIKKTFSRWWAKDPFRESAVIAYFSIFSIPALLVIVIAIAAFFFGQEAVRGQISSQISSAVNQETAKFIEQIIAKATVAKKSTIATILGIGMIVFGSTRVLVQFKKSLNIIWEVKTVSNGIKWWSMIKSRLLSLGLIVTIGFLLMISMIITALVTVFSKWMQDRFPDIIPYLLEGGNFIISLGVITIMFALMFKILPDAKIKWKHVLLGGFLTALLFIIGKFAIGFYFGKSSPASVYGAAGSVVLILLWVSYSSMIVFLGAEFTKAYVDHLGDKVEASEHAINTPGLSEEYIRATNGKADEKDQEKAKRKQELPGDRRKHR